MPSRAASMSASSQRLIHARVGLTVDHEAADAFVEHQTDLTDDFGRLEVAVPEPERAGGVFGCGGLESGLEGIQNSPRESLNKNEHLETKERLNRSS